MKKEVKLNIFLTLFWVSNFLIFEILIFPFYISLCNFSKPSNQILESHKLIIISDPQLTDLNSYRFIAKNSMKLIFVQYLSDLYMKKNFKILNNKFDKEFSSFVFLGDMMDSGRYETDVEFEEENNRFKTIFKSEKQKFFIPGNHDIGLSRKLFHF
jgi:hypothetical protein